MASFSRILCVIDPTAKEQPALARASWLAEHTGAALDLLICYYNEYLSGERFFDSKSLQKTRKETLELQKQSLEKLAKPLRSDGLDVTTNAVWGHPLHDCIVQHASDLKSDIVLKDTHHHSVLARSIFSNTDWNLVRNCPVPLWLVKPGDIGKQPQIIAAVDPLNEHDKPATLDDEIVDIGQALAKAVGGELHGFHSYDPRISLSAGTAEALLPLALPFAEIEAQIHDEHEDKFRSFASKHKLAKERTHLVAGLTHKELPALVQELDAALVVMGAVSRNRAQRAFVGATAERTLEELPCDLLVVKPDWFQSAADGQTSNAA